MRKTFLFLLVLLLLLGNNLCRSQCLTINLIKNPGLEEYTCCPNNAGMIDCANYWTQPMLEGSTSEYLNVCGIDSLEIPSMLPFFQHAYFGNGYAGICCYNYITDVTPPSDYREYIQGTLSESLKSGQCYYCEFWVESFNLGIPYSAIDALGIYFSDTLPKIPGNYVMRLLLPAQINNTVGRIITDTSKWTKIADTFVAKGGEKYFTVGTFKQPSEVNQTFTGTPLHSDAYYFFDKFSLCPCEDTIPLKEPAPIIYIPNIFSPNNDGQNDKLFVKGQAIGSLHFLIYNRWGNLVFESNDINQGWDGTQNGKPCDAGVYVYRAEITFKNGETITKRGDVTLVR